MDSKSQSQAKLELEGGEQSQSGKRKKESERSSSSSSDNGGIPPMTMKTVAKISKRPRNGLQPDTKCTLYDNTSRGYGWLLPGWLAEERHMDSGRVYRYYYDPEGNLYRSQSEVIATWEKSGMIVIDK